MEYNIVSDRRLYNSNKIRQPYSLTSKCVVIDIDHTLVSTQENIETLKKLNVFSDPNLISLRKRIYHIILENSHKRGDGSKDEFWGITRPHVKEFLLFCFSYFKVVAIWSAGKKSYVESVVNFLFKDLPPPDLIFTFNDTEDSPGGFLVKPLDKMFSSSSVFKKNMSFENTFIIDDTVETTEYNKKNGIIIPPYKPSTSLSSLERDDPTLLQLKYWLLTPEVANSSDIRDIDKSNIFTKPLREYEEEFKKTYGYTFS